MNYFDTAYVYHQGESEEFLGEALRKYPRDSFYLATKTPGHLINPDYDPVEAFERQLRRCETDYFDFYLLHNVMESSLPTYTNPDLRVMDYLLEQKAKGHIRHLGISSHGQLPMLERYMKSIRQGDRICPAADQLPRLEPAAGKGEIRIDHQSGAADHRDGAMQRRQLGGIGCGECKEDENAASAGLCSVLGIPICRQSAERFRCAQRYEQHGAGRGQSQNILPF